MATPGSQDDAAAQKPVEQWTTGDEPMTGAQRSYITTLAQQAGEDVESLHLENTTKAEASELIERLQARSNEGPADSGTES
jgi:uncharacterized protein YgiM (DUF1202 family)